MKQTAVEFLHSEYKKILYNVIVTPEQVMEMAYALAQANKIFKQHIIDARANGVCEGIDIGGNLITEDISKNHEIYYNETFNK